MSATHIGPQAIDEAAAWSNAALGLAQLPAPVMQATVFRMIANAADPRVHAMNAEPRSAAVHRVGGTVAAARVELKSAKRPRKRHERENMRRFPCAVRAKRVAGHTLFSTALGAKAMVAPGRLRSLRAAARRFLSGTPTAA